MVVKIFLDTSEISEYQKYKDLISGGTTNPSLMSKQGVSKENYKEHCKNILEIIGNGVLSVEVTQVIPSKMFQEAIEYSSWDERIVVKVPCSFYIKKSLAVKLNPEEYIDDPYALNLDLEDKANLLLVNTLPLIHKLAQEGIPLNVTCGFCFEQARDTAQVITKAQKEAKKPAKSNYFSIFWGRLLDDYLADPTNKAKEFFNTEDLEKMLKKTTEEIEDSSKQLEGSNISLILGSSRLPKLWEKNAKILDQEQKTDKNSLQVKKEAYRSLIRLAAKFNAIPTVSPAVIEAGRYDPNTSIAVNGFIEDFLSLKK